jgi:RNA polymerase sigma-70 factor (ECF subfamily)
LFNRVQVSNLLAQLKLQAARYLEPWRTPSEFSRIQVQKRNLRRIAVCGDNMAMETQLIEPVAGGMNGQDRLQREAMLRQAVLAGDETAWRAWCLESFDELDRFVLWRCGGRRDLADDVVQETWLTAVRRIRRFDPTRASFLTWLRGIAANVRRNHTRKERRFAVERFSTNGEAAVDPAATANQQDRAETIAEVLDALSERQEAVLRAKYFDGLTVEEIAQAWSETPKAVESLLTRSRAAFRERFERLMKQAE